MAAKGRKKIKNIATGEPELVIAFTGDKRDNLALSGKYFVKNCKPAVMRGNAKGVNII